MNRKRNLLLAVGILILLVGGYLLVLFLSPDEDAGTTETAGEPVLSLTLDQIASISYRYGEETATLEREDDGWTLAEEDDFPLDQTTADTMASALLIR